MNERSRWLTLALVILSVLALLAFAACGGGDDDDDDGGDATATATQDGGDDGGDDDGDDTPTDAPDDGDDDDGDDPFANLDELAEGLDQVTGKISYQMTNDGEVTAFTVYSDGTNSRYDTVDESGTISSYITTADQSYACDSESESCISYPSGGGLGGVNIFSAFLGSSAVGAYVAAAEVAGVDVDTSSEEHAGTDTECFSWTEDVDGDESTGKICFADSGVMLYEEFADADGTFLIEATDFSEDVSDSDFEPPYDVTEIPGQ